MVKFDEQTIKQAGEGNLVAMHQIKQALTSLPPDSAYEVFRSSLNCYDGTVLRQAKALSQQARAEARARHYIETGPAGVPFINKAPKVIGEGESQELVWKTRTAYLACFENARVWGGSALIDAGGEVLFDFEDWEIAIAHDHFNFDPRIFRADLDNIHYIDDADKQPDIVLDRAFPLLGWHSDWFGHWLWEYLPKFAAALQTQRLPPLTVLVEDHLAPTQRESIERLLPPGANLLGVKFNACVFVRELWCAPTLHFAPLWPSVNPYNWNSLASPPERFKVAIAAMNAPFPPAMETQRSGRKIFLSRHTRSRRQMVNWQEVEALCSRLGFDIVIPEALTFSEQVAAIRSADYILGPEGSAFYLTFYATPGTKVCMLNHPDLEAGTILPAILEAIGVDAIYFTGPFASLDPLFLLLSDYTIDCDRLETFIKGWAGI